MEKSQFWNVVKSKHGVSSRSAYSLMSVEITRRQFISCGIGATALLLSGCTEGRSRSQYNPRPRYLDDPTPVPLDPRPSILAKTASFPLSRYLLDLENTATSFIHLGYLEQGVHLSSPRSPNFGLKIQDELIADKVLTTVKAIIQSGRAGRQPFVLENRYLPTSIILYESKIITGTFTHLFIRPDLIPGQPLGNVRELERLSKDQMVALPKHIFRFPPSLRWQNSPEWVTSPNLEIMVLRGADNQGRGFVVSVFDRINASLAIRM